MKSIHLLSTLIILSLLCLSCSEDHSCDEGLVELPNAIADLSGEEYNQSREACRRPRVQTFSFPGFEGGVFLGNQGTQITIPAQSILNQDGNPIDQTVTLELIEMYEAGEIIACQLSTNGISTSPIPEPLLTEGIYYLNLTVDDPDIIISVAEAITVFSPSNNQGLTLNQFNSLSCQALECLVLWEPNIGVEVIGATIDNPDGTITTGYQTFVRELGWVSVSRLNPDPSTRTIIYNKAPSGYNSSNSKSFILYEGASIGVGLFQGFDIDLEVFTEMYGQIPTGTSSHFILVTVQDGAYRFASQSTVIGMDQIGLTTQTTDATEIQFISTINALQ